MRCDRVQFFLIRFLCQEPAGSLWAPGSHFPADGPSGPEGGGWGGTPASGSLCFVFRNSTWPHCSGRLNCVQAWTRGRRRLRRNDSGTRAVVLRCVRALRTHTLPRSGLLVTQHRHTAPRPTDAGSPLPPEGADTAGGPHPSIEGQGRRLSPAHPSPCPWVLLGASVLGGGPVSPRVTRASKQHRGCFSVRACHPLPTAMVTVVTVTVAVAQEGPCDGGRSHIAPSSQPRRS